jgi:hypothetical protein
MRVKIRTNDIEDKNLKYGKRYGIDIWGASFWFEFTFTRKKNQSVTLMGSSGSQETLKISNRKLKQLIHDENVTRFVFEVQH